MGFIDGPNHHEVSDLIANLIERIYRSGKIVGMVARNAREANEYIALGARLLFTSLTSLLKNCIIELFFIE
jgi:2-keto-3-deoxy-L-rhamnonate aldolase RhmA